MKDGDPKGGFFPMDDQGYIINPTNLAFIPTHWQPLLNALKDYYQEQFGPHFRSMWIRGSLARGLFWDGLSDLDTFALISGDPHLRWEPCRPAKLVVQKWTALFPQGYTICPIEMMYSSFDKDDQVEMPRISMLIKTQSVCWWGDDVSADLAPIKPGPGMCLHYRWLASDWLFLQQMKTPDARTYRTYIKALIRTAFELIMEDLGKFTPDLFWAVESFAQYYPQKSAQMKKILNLYVHPLDKKQQLTTLLEEITPWILSESKRLTS